MDAHRFLSLQRFPRERSPAAGEWAKALSITLFGYLLFWMAGPLLHHGWEIAAAWSGLYGMLFILHFGLFHILSCAWRSAGIDAQAIMNRPLSSRSIVEFWGQRWNLAFRDVAHAAVFRPLAHRWGYRPAIMGVFLFSGILHELAISLPAQGGYGLPTLYFLGQLTAVMINVSPRRKRLALVHGWRNRMITIAIVVVPSPILFHPPFLKNVIVPFLRTVLLPS